MITEYNNSLKRKPAKFNKNQGTFLNDHKPSDLSDSNHSHELSHFECNASGRSDETTEYSILINEHFSLLKNYESVLKNYTCLFNSFSNLARLPLNKKSKLIS